MLSKNMKKEILTVPNLLSLFRLLLIPLYIVLYLRASEPDDYIVAAAILAVSCLTDMIDGKIARQFNQITTLGKFLDPIADKLLTSSVLFMLIVDGTIPAPWGVIVVTIIIAREFMVSALRLIAASKGIVLAADIWGKAKTMVQMIAIPVCMLIPFLIEIVASEWLVLTAQIIGWAAIGVATVLTVVSGINYLVKNKDCFKENKK